MGKFKNSSPFDFQSLAKLDPMRPSRKFSAPKGDDEACDDELREKQALRAQRLQALAEETFDEDAFAKRKSEFAANLLNDEYVFHFTFSAIQKRIAFDFNEYTFLFHNI